jgi:hypothetical protein
MGMMPSALTIPCSKYPPSLLYVMMTLGPALLFLAFFETRTSRTWQYFQTFGRVPLFYYLLHLPLIHVMAVLFSLVTYGEASWLYRDLMNSRAVPSLPAGYGYGLTVLKVEHRFSGGFSVINSFTWSKLYEDTSLIDGNTEIAGKPLVEHKLGGEDRPFHLSIAPIWELPVGRGKKFGSGMPKIANAVVGGWELTGQYTIQSGVPVVFSNNSFFTGKDFALPRDKQSLDQWFDTSQFLAFPSKNTPIASIPAWTGVQNLPGYSYVPAPGDSAKNGVYQDFATYIRNYPTRWSDVRASRVNELNLGIFKNFHPTERTKLQLRFEAFNALNHPRFPAPDTNPASSTFGVVQKSEQNNARAIQMGAKLSF